MARVSLIEDEYTYTVGYDNPLKTWFADCYIEPENGHSDEEEFIWESPLVHPNLGNIFNQEGGPFPTKGSLLFWIFQNHADSFNLIEILLRRFDEKGNPLKKTN